MIQQNAEEGKMDETEFVREIKGYRFTSRLIDQQIHLTLSNLESDEYFQIYYDNSTLPENVRKYFTTIGQLQFYIREKTKIFKLLSPGIVMCAQYMGRVQKFITVDMKPCGNQDAKYMVFLKRYCRQLVEDNIAVKTQLKAKELDYQNLEIENKRMKKLLDERNKDIERLKEQIDTLRNRKKSVRKDKDKQKEKEKDSNSKDSRDSKERDIIKKEVISEESEQRIIVVPIKPIKKKKSRTSPRRVIKQQEKTEFGPSQSEEEDTPHMEDQNNEDSIYNEESSPEDKLPQIKKQVRQIFSMAEKLIPFTINQECKNINRFQVESNHFQKILNSNTYQMYSTEPFLLNQRSYFSILLEKSKYKSLTMGLITAQLFELTSSSAEKGCVCYEGYYGIVIVQGKEDNKDYRKLKEGDILSTMLDPEKKLIEWRINLQIIAKVSLPQTMQNCALFPYFELEDKGDRLIVNPESP